MEAWFVDLKDALGASQGADRGRVLASVRKLVAENESYAKEKLVVAKALGHSRWGDLYNWANEKLVAVPEVELPEVFNEPPNGLVFRPGGDYDKAQKRLVKTRLRVKELWAYLDGEVADDPSLFDWAENAKAQVIEAFLASKNAEEFDQECVAFIRDVDRNADPDDEWVEVAGEAAAVLELDADLPFLVVEDLLSYARGEGVEATRRNIKEMGSSINPANRWFDYLLTAYFLQKTRPEHREIQEAITLFNETTKLLECFELVDTIDPRFPALTKKRSYDQALNLEQLTEGIRKYAEMKKENMEGTYEDWQEALKEVVSAVSPV